MMQSFTSFELSPEHSKQFFLIAFNGVKCFFILLPLINKKASTSALAEANTYPARLDLLFSNSLITKKPLPEMDFSTSSQGSIRLPYSNILEKAKL